MAYAPSDFVVVGNGAIGGKVTSGTTPAATTLYIGASFSGTNSINGHIKRFAYWPTRLTDAELQTVTTTDPDAIGYSSGFVNVLQMTFNGEVPAAWGQEYLAQVLFAATSGRYLTVEIDDTTNAAGYVQAGRLFVANAFQPAINASYGLQSGRDDLSTVTSSISGVRYATARRRPRTEKFTLQYALQAEADRIHEMYGEIGAVDEVLYVPDPADSSFSQRYGFLGYLEQLGPLDYPIPLRRSIPFQVKEKL